MSEKSVPFHQHLWESADAGCSVCGITRQESFLRATFGQPVEAQPETCGKPWYPKLNGSGAGGECVRDAGHAPPCGGEKGGWVWSDDRDVYEIAQGSLAIMTADRNCLIDAIDSIGRLMERRYQLILIGSIEEYAREMSDLTVKINEELTDLVRLARDWKATT